MSFRFAHPELLWLLLLIPLLALLLGRAGPLAAVRFPAIGLARQIAIMTKARVGKLRWLGRFLTLAFLILAIARPQTGEELRDVEYSGIDIMMAVDLSTSMWAHDFELDGSPTDRLTPLKRVMTNFVDQRPSDRIGLIAFAAHPWLASPLTLNHDWVNSRIQDLRIGMVEDGTAIGSAIAASASRLHDSDSKSRIIILLTDGANNRGWIDPIPAAQAASALGIRIYSIGVGRIGVVPFPSRFDADGKPMRNRLGQIMFDRWESDVDLPTLQQIATIGNGRYFHATNTQALEEIYAEIDQLEKTEIRVQVRYDYTDFFWVPLLASLLILVLEQLLALTRFRTLP
jgi:Ca-activated chloride channel homolog